MYSGRNSKRGRGSQIPEERLKKNLKENIEESKEIKDCFQSIYLRWLPMRRNSLSELKALKEEVHEDQMGFNKAHGIFKEVGYHSRSLKKNASFENAEFWGSFGAFLSEAANGITSIAQAVNIDKYKTKFEAIMKKDEENTKRMHNIRSKCFEKYQGIEEIIRKFNSTTFDSALTTILSSLRADKFWVAVTNAYGNGDMLSMVQNVDNMLQVSCRRETFEEIGKSVKTYTDSNPAVLDACASTARAIYCAVDTWGENKKKNQVMRHVSFVADDMMMTNDRTEADRYRRMVLWDESQCSLETHIQQAIDDFESEMTEMINMYDELF